MVAVSLDAALGAAGVADAAALGHDGIEVEDLDAIFGGDRGLRSRSGPPGMLSGPSI